MEHHSALIAMSGGVDSSVAAYLTASQGVSCIGVTMKLFQNDTVGLSRDKTCCSLDDAEDARAVARRLGIPFYVFNFHEEFEEQVISKFVRSYEQGLTPSPCIDCNRFLKFGKLLERAMILGCDTVVTGHYATVRQDPVTGRYLMYKAADRAKDQTYFLAGLTQQQLQHIRFPLGSLTKDQVRSIALEQGFLNAGKRDSQDICFVPDGDYVAFLQRYTGKAYPQGAFLDRNGQVVGTHRGAVCYTLGQRKGLGLAMGEPVYVCAKDMAANTVTVGSEDALYSCALRAGDFSWLPFQEPENPLPCTVKIRHSQQEHSAVLYPEAGGTVRVKFDTPQRAVTPGQAVVAYLGDLVLGGGTILEAIP